MLRTFATESGAVDVDKQFIKREASIRHLQRNHQVGRPNGENAVE